jgi:hypothetical protein
MAQRSKVALVIAVPVEWIDLPHIEELRQQGHQVVPQDFRSFDLVLAPQAHQMGEELLPYLPAAISAAKRRKGGKA